MAYIPKTPNTSTSSMWNEGAKRIPKTNAQNRGCGTKKLRDFTAWLDRKGNSPKEMMDGIKIREIPGLSRTLTQ
jgi:hypothetical protein